MVFVVFFFYVLYFTGGWGWLREGGGYERGGGVRRELRCIYYNKTLGNIRGWYTVYTGQDSPYFYFRQIQNIFKHIQELLMRKVFLSVSARILDIGKLFQVYGGAKKKNHETTL